jgi:hypothetical protein
LLLTERPLHLTGIWPRGRSCEAAQDSGVHLDLLAVPFLLINREEDLVFCEIE